MNVTSPARPPHSSDSIDREAFDELVEALIEEARQRARRRRRKIAAIVLLAVMVGVATVLLFRRTAVRSQGASPSRTLSSAPRLGALTALRGFVSAFAFDPRAPDTVYAATSGDGVDDRTSGRVYKSTDGGKHWQSTTRVGWTRVDALAVDPQRPETLYAGTGEAVYKTVNGGRSWHGSSRGVFRFFPPGPGRLAGIRAYRRAGGWVTSLAVDPTDSDIVYAGTVAGVLRSTDAGRSWRTVLRPGRYVDTSALVITPSRPQVIYAAADIFAPGCAVNTPRCARFSHRLYRSADGGESWRDTGLRMTSKTNTIMLAFDPRRPSTLYVASGKEVLTSTDAGASWRSIVDGLPKRGSSALAVDPRGSGTVYLADGAVLKTTDRGRTWSRISSGSDITALAVDPARPGTIYAGIDRNHRARILKSTDGARTWTTAI